MTRFRPLTAIAAWCVVCLATGLLARLPPGGEPPPKPVDPAPVVAADKQPPFPDFGFMPPGHAEDKLFRLRQNYPDTEPKADKRPGFLTIPFNENADGQENWRKYLLAVRDYCFEGNLEVDWVLQNNKKRDWYHAPWLHWGPKGREGLRGLTREATSQPKQLASTQTGKFQTYAVAFYNEFGGYTIRRVWEKHYAPDPAAARFPVGTVVCKLLFTQAASDQVPYLADPIEWEVYGEKSAVDSTRVVQKMRLIQMDVMVRDERAEKINGGGWVFGTFCYNGILGNSNKWYNLVPVGLQWGNDPTIKEGEVNPQATTTIINKKLKESVINPSHELPPQHLGWGGRLNGPADYFASSCMSCHSTAQYPVMRLQNPEFGRRQVLRGEKEWMVWFRNLKCGQPFSEEAKSLDYSLQLTIGIQNFHHWHDEQGGKFARVEEGLQRFKQKQEEVKRGKE